MRTGDSQVLTVTLCITPILHSCQYRNFLKKVVQVSSTVLTATKE